MLNAAEANSRTHEMINKNLEELDKKITEKINDAIRRGEFSVMYSLSGNSPSVQNAIRQRLKDAGFTLKESEGGDQRDYGYVTISWSEE